MAEVKRVKRPPAMVSTKVMRAIMAALIASAILTNSSYAWLLGDQEALNKTKDQAINPGGRLHIDAYFQDMNIYVENFTSPDDGMPIFARVRLREYMELGEGAGEKDQSLRGEDINVLGNPGADINHTSTWDLVYMADTGLLDGVSASRPYFQIQTGGQGVYMPTFNKNKDSHQGDINGTLAGPDAIEDTLYDAYKDFIRYSLDSALGVTEVTAIATYDADEDDIEEEDPVIATPTQPALDPDIYQVEETHYATLTADALVITMADWKQLPEEEQIGSYWVYDTDGWAYWASPILPGETTGLLLDYIQPIQDLEQDWYYEINGYGEYATLGAWGDPEDKSGFYLEGITTDGLRLLELAASSLE